MKKLIFFALILAVNGFDVQEFKKNFCYEDKNITTTSSFFPYDIGHWKTLNGFVCENFTLSNRDLRQAFNLSNSENVFLKNCEIEYFNEDIVSKFPNVAWLDVQNCNVTLKNSGNWNKSSSLEYLAFHESRIFNNLNSSSLQSFDKLWTILIQNSSLQYSYIDDNLLPKTNNFYNILFDNVNIERINDKVLENLKHSILRISCTSCQLKEIKPIFKNMNYTVYDDFRFSNNKVKKLPSSKDIFKNYDKLLVIDLSNNQIKERILSRKHFKTLKSLKILYLNNNANINFISQFAFNDTALEELNISNVNLRSLGKLGNSNLKKIDVSKNRISKISLEAFEDLIKLEVLDLSNNKILKLNGSEFKDLQSLHELHLSSNKLKEIHENLFNKTSKLQKLDLSLNDLENIVGLEFLKSLEQLSLQENKIKVIPSSLPGSLQSLDISRNSLDSIKNGTFNNLTQLTSLDISETNRTYLSFDRDFLRPLVSLKSLKISKNHLESLEQINFPESLEELHLEYNEITTLTSKGFENLENLKFLNLSYNRIDFIEEGVLEKLKNITVVDLTGNNL